MADGNAEKTGRVGPDVAAWMMGMTQAEIAALEIKLTAEKKRREEQRKKDEEKKKKEEQEAKSLRWRVLDDARYALQALALLEGSRWAYQYMDHNGKPYCRTCGQPQDMAHGSGCRYGLLKHNIEQLWDTDKGTETIT